MNAPPPSRWQPPQPNEPPHGSSQYSSPPGGFPPNRQQPGYPSGEWPQRPPQPQKGNTLKWLLVAIVLLLVVGVTIGATLLVSRGGVTDPSTPPTSGAGSSIASAEDVGPVAIPTEDPTCKALSGINRTVADIEANGWSDQRQALGPYSDWTSEQRDQVKAVVTAITNASDEMATLARQTPHRVMRELYIQYIAYGKAYADAIESYQPNDNVLADVNVSIGNALLGICNAIDFGSASRAVAIESAASPSDVGPVTDPSGAEPFLSTTNTVCDPWVMRERAFIAETAVWEQLDPNVPGASWSPEQRAVQMDALQKFKRLADASVSAGQDSDNPVFEDLATLTALYLRAYAATGDGYVPADSWLSYSAARLNNTVARACEASAL